ncbi:hypothetical protein [Photobacterium swingsii]|uniref:hypothetical protein n=1 Tax=Photobacterium swingsii TaxID=680026 RepID=UPI0040695B0D
MFFPRSVIAGKQQAFVTAVERYAVGCKHQVDNIHQAYEGVFIQRRDRAFE